MSYPFNGIRNRFGRTASATALTGTAWTKPSPSGQMRSGVEIRNPDASLSIWGRGVARGASTPTAPSGIATDADFAIAPGASLFLAWSDSIDIYLCNSSGASTTSGYVMSEVGY